MAKVSNPFFSLAASGTVGGLLCARMGKDGAQVMRPPRNFAPPSPEQLAQRQKMIDARAAYLQMDNQARADWDSVAMARGMPTWNAYFAEWQYQQVTAGDQPLIPEPTL
jgi:hypothetical protein